MCNRARKLGVKQVGDIDLIDIYEFRGKQRKHLATVIQNLRVADQISSKLTRSHVAAILGQDSVRYRILPGLRRFG